MYSQRIVMLCLTVWINCCPAAMAQQAPAEMAQHAARAVNQSRELQEQGKYVEALRAIEQEVGIIAGNWPKEHYLLSQLILEAGNIRMAVGLYNEAASNYAASAERIMKILPSVKPETALLPFHMTAEALTRAGRFAEAEPIYEQAVGFAEEALPDDSLELARELNGHGSLLISLGKHELAKKQLQRALDVRQKFFSEDKFPRGNWLIAVTQSNLGLAAQEQGDWYEALKYYHESEKAFLRFFPPSEYPRGHIAFAQLYTNLGVLHNLRNESIQAREYHEKSVELYRIEHPGGHPSLARAIHNLAAYLETIGELSASYKLLVQARNMFVERGVGADSQTPSSDLAFCYSSLGRVERRLGLLDEALASLHSALKMRKNIYSPEFFPRGHEHLARSYEDLGVLHNLMDRRESAIVMLEQALQVRRSLYDAKSHPQGHMNLARSINNLAIAYQDQGQYSRAIELYEESLAVNQKLYPDTIYPNGHEHLAHSHTNLSRALLSRDATEDAERASDLLTDAHAMYGNLSNSIVTGISESEAMNLSRILPRLNDDLVLAWHRAKKSAASLYHVIWESKGERMRYLSARSQELQASTDPEIRQLRLQYLRANQLLASFYLNFGSQALESEKGKQRIAKLQTEKEVLEREFNRTIRGTSRSDQAPSSVDQLIAQLPDKTVLIDYYLYHDHESDESKYLAFLVAKDQTITKISLGPAKPIDQAVRDWRLVLDNYTELRKKASKSKQPFPSTDSPQRLRKLIWERVEQHFPKGTTTAYLCPAGALYFLPWVALPGREEGRYLIEEYLTIEAPNPKWLLDQLRETPDWGEEQSRLLAVGGVEFAKPPVEGKTKYSMISYPWTPEMADYDQYRREEDSSFLPGSVPESKFSAYLGNGRPTLLCIGTEASRDAVVAALPQARWAHLATHGALRDPEGSKIQQQNDLKSLLQLDSRFVLDPVERQSSFERNPLLYSHLLFAGATTKKRFGNRLSAAEIAALSLQHLELAVLSACQTSLGETELGEGVYALPRAFHQAGTRHVLATLWSVDDAVGQKLMMLTMYKILKESKPPAVALREAQWTALRHLDRLLQWDGTKPLEIDLTSHKTEQPIPYPHHEYYWAPFVASGVGVR